MATVGPTPEAQDGAPGTGREWLRLLAWLTGAVAVVDLVFIALVRELILPLLVGAVLTGVGIALVRRLPRSATIVLGLTSLVMIVGALQFSAEHLGDPSSGIDFTHAAVGIFGRLTAIAVAVVALRRRASAGARRVGAAAVGVLAVVLLVASVATLATTGDEAQPGDVVITITDFDFAETIDVTVGDTLFVDNLEPFRHTFTSGGHLSGRRGASQGVRIAIEVEPGVYVPLGDRRGRRRPGTAGPPPSTPQPSG